VALYNGYFSATVSWAEGLEILEYARIGDRWRGGSKCSGEESRERKQVELTLGGLGGGETREVSAVIHVRHVKREGEPKRNTCVEREYLLCVEVIVVCSVIDRRSALTTVSFSYLKFQSFDIVWCLRVLRGRDTDVLRKVRCFYVHGKTSTKEKQVIKSLRRSACLRASNNALLRDVHPYVLSNYIIPRTNVKIRCACQRVSNDILWNVFSFGADVESIMCEIWFENMEIGHACLHGKCGDGYQEWLRCLNALSK
jgi:hypothetical protein